MRSTREPGDRPAGRDQPRGGRAAGIRARARSPDPSHLAGWPAIWPCGRAWGVGCPFRRFVSIAASATALTPLALPGRPGPARRADRRHRDARAGSAAGSAGPGPGDRPRRDRAQRCRRSGRHPALPRGARARAQRRAGPDHGRVHTRRRQQSHAGAGGWRADQPGHDRARGAAEHRHAPTSSG